MLADSDVLGIFANCTFCAVAGLTNLSVARYVVGSFTREFGIRVRLRDARRATKWLPGNCTLRPFALVTTSVMLSRSYSLRKVGSKVMTIRLSPQVSIPSLTGLGLF